jgi:hypothetical protein
MGLCVTLTDEATINRIFSQDKQREASVALDRVAMGRSRQHDAQT